MDTKKRVVLIPQYIGKFSCITSECEDICCAGWQIDIDNETYEKYRRLNNRELRELFKKHIKRNRSNKTKERYAKIRLNDKNECSFLTNNRLCKIQLKCGESFLSPICKTYPRMNNLINGGLERSGTLSCPEMARLALLNQEIMVFEKIEETVNINTQINGTFNINLANLENNPLSCFWELRIFSIEVLQNRSYKLWERLIILGMFYQNIQKQVDIEMSPEIPKIISSYQNLIAEGFFKEALATTPTSCAVQMELLKEIADRSIAKGVTSQQYYECFAQFLHGIQYTNGASVEEITKLYQESYEYYYQPYMVENEFILENYLVNYAFMHLFPFGGGKNLFYDYVILVLNYSMIKLHLIGMAGFHKELNQQLVIKLIHSFARTVEHDPVYLGQIFTLLEQHGFVGMSYMSILIKN